MTIGELCTREVVFASREATVRTAAVLMREHHVGCVVLVNEVNGRRIPTGVVTDRDIVVAVTALGLDPDVIRAGDVAASKLVELREDASITDAVSAMRSKGVRRLPVVDREGALVGIIAADDVLSLLAEDMSGLARMVSRAHRLEEAQRRTHAEGRA
jgi:CBS domain-containing protein